MEILESAKLKAYWGENALLYCSQCLMEKVIDLFNWRGDEPNHREMG